MDTQSESVLYDYYYRKLCDNLTSGLQMLRLIYDDRGRPIDGITLDANSVFANLLGYRKKEIVGKRIKDIIPNIDPSCFRMCYEVIKTRNMAKFEEYSSILNCWLKIQILPIEETDKLLIIYKNISKDKEIEEELRKKGEVIRSFSNNPLGLHTIFKPVYNDKNQIIDLICVYQNHGSQTRGKTPKEFVGTPISKILTNFLESNIFKNIIEVIETGQAKEFEEPCIHKGQWAWYHIVANPVEIGVELFAQVITRQKDAEQALKERETKYRILFETSNDGFWWIDKDGYVTEVNEGTARILGYSQEEIIGMAWENFVADDWVDRESKEIEKRKLGIANRYSMQLKKRDGSPIWVLASSSPLIDENGNYNGTLSAFKDITEQKLAKEKLVEGEKKALKLVAELEEVDRNKNEFLSILSHELRNPLAAIKGGIKILELKAKDEEVLKITEILNRQTDHLSNLVNDLLDITRINKNKLILNKEQVKLNNIVINVITDMELQFSNKKIKLYENICKEELYVEADPVRITQCIGNVLGNALKFTNENGNVCVSLHIEAGFGVINIKDDGIGISQEAIDRIFEPFKQELRHVKSHNNRGLGLGLSLVREIIQMHGGDVSVISKGLGQGALFTMRIPLVDNSK